MKFLLTILVFVGMVCPSNIFYEDAFAKADTSIPQSLDHKYYVSVTLAEYRASKQRMQFKSRVFIDDIERLLQERYNEDIRLDGTEDETYIEGLIEKYFKQKFLATVDGETLDFTFYGYDVEPDEYIVFFESQKLEHIPTQVKIENTVLMDAFSEQQNLIHVKVADQRKSLLLTNGDTRGSLTFN